MDLRLERLTLERAHTAELLELVTTVDHKARPFTFAKRMAEMKLRHNREMDKLRPTPMSLDPRNVPRDPVLVGEVLALIQANPGIARKDIVEGLSEPYIETEIRNALTTLRRRGSIANRGTRKSPQWHPVTDLIPQRTKE